MGESKQGWSLRLSLYVLAIVLPLLCTYLTLTVPWLRDIPFALAFASVAIVAWCGSVGPTALVIALSVLLFDYSIAVPRGQWAFSGPDLARALTLLVVASFIGATTIRLRRAQRRVALDELRYRATLASIGDGVIATDPSGQITFCNPAGEALTGWRFEEAKGKLLDEVLVIQDESTGAPVESPVSMVRRTGQIASPSQPRILIRRDGTMLNIDDTGAPVFGEGGQLTGVVIVLRDVSSRRSSERLLEEQTVALVAAQEGSNAAAWALDTRKELTRWFPGGREIFGRPFADFSTHPSPLHLVEKQDHPAIAEALQRVREGGDEFRVEFRVPWPNGEVHWLEARGKPSPLDRRILYGVTADITERKLAEAAILRAEKLSAVGQVASTMAHEINNPLAGIVNLLYLALTDKHLGEETRAYLQTASDEIARLAAITRLTLTFARESPGATAANVAVGVENVLSLVKGRLASREVQVVQEIDGETMVRIKPHELRQVLLNVTLNAIDALNGDHCMLRITAGRDGEWTRIRIEDNGCGIPRHQLERIFDPFFSTKPEIGTGIGLWVSRELLQRCGGTISAESGELGDGYHTRFEIRLPGEFDAQPAR